MLNRLVFSPIWGSWILVLLVVFVLGAVVILIPPVNERLGPRGKKVIFTLRLLCVLILGTLMLRPTIVYTEVKKLPASLYLLLDSSQSMSVRDEVGGKSRFELAKKTLQDSEKTLQDLQKRFDIHPFFFDEMLYPLEMSRGVASFPEKPEGKETAIGFALEEIYQRAAGKRILATVLFSDGTQRSKATRDLPPRDAVLRFRDANIPLYTVPLGKPGVSENLDVAVRDLIAAEQIFVKNELIVSGQIRINGYTNQQIPVRMLFETSPGQMEEVASRTITATEEGQLVNYRFQYIPQSTGLKKITVEIPLQPREIVNTNNEMSSFIRVLEGGLNVLYLEGSTRSEQVFLKRSIDSSADIQLRYERFPQQQLIARSHSLQGGAISARDMLLRWRNERDSLVKDYFSPNRFTVYMIGDLDCEAFKSEELEALSELVKNGAGLIMLGGYHSFGAGGYAQSPLTDVLPITMQAADRQILGADPDPALHWDIPMRMLPSDLGKNHFILRLAETPAANMKMWESLPELKGANRRMRTKQAAVVLANGPEGPLHQPLLIQGLYGAGRVLAFAGDTTWKWCMYEHEREHKRFWRQVILWLAKMDESLQGDCWIELDKTRFSAGDIVKFRVRLRNEKGEEVLSPKVDARVRFPDGREESLLMVDENGVATGSVRNAKDPGDYVIRATAGTGAASMELKESSARFIVFDQNLELDNPVADPTLLGSLATITGGTTIPPESFAKLLEDITEKAELLTEKRETKLSLYDSWPMLILLCAVLCIEWFLRKKWGMI